MSKAIKPAKAHHMTPHMHRSLGIISRDANLTQGVRHYGSPGYQNKDMSMKHGKAMPMHRKKY